MKTLVQFIAYKRHFIYFDILSVYLASKVY